MIAYILRRLLSGLIMLLVFVSAVFFLSQILLPGDYVSQFALGLSPDEAEAARHQLGLDTSIALRYLDWLFRLAHGDLGFSYSIGGQGPPVFEIIKNNLPATILVYGLGTGLAFTIGFALGKITSWRGTRWLGRITVPTGILLYTSFPPWLVFLLAYFFGEKLGLIKFVSTSFIRSIQTPYPPEVMFQMVVGLLAAIAFWIMCNTLLRRFYRRSLPGWVIFLLVSASWVASWYLFGFGLFSLTILKAAILPITAFTLLSFGEIMLITRTTMMDTVYEEYITTARAKGLREAQVRDHHAARNALLPVISRLAISLPYLMAGMIMIEQTLRWSGMGTVLFYALGQQDVPLAIGALLFIGLFLLIVRISMDIAYAMLDPRTRIVNRTTGRVL
jgi:peptide/nickel transport system permease protein